MGKPGKCVACGKKFQTKNKGYKRFSLKSQLGPSFGVDVAAALSQAVPEMIDKFPDEGHVCDSCFRLLRTTLRQREQLLKTEIEWEMRLRSGPQGKRMPKSRVRGKTHKNESRTSKRKLEEVQNIMNNPHDSNSRSERRRKRMKLEPTVAVLCKNGGHKNYMKKSIAYLIQYRYHKAFSIIIAESERAKKAFIGVMKKEIRKEAFYFCKRAEKLPQETAIKNFSWKKELKKMELEMPTFYSACHAAMDTRKGTVMNYRTSPSSRKRPIRPRLGLMMTLPLYTRREKKFGFVMNILSLLFHRYSSHEKMLKILRHLGVCHWNSQPLIRKVDGMKAEECEKLLAWAVKNLAEVKSHDGVAHKSSHKGKAPKAQLPPTDSNHSEDSDSDDVESDDENTMVDDDKDDDGEDDDDDDDDDVSSLLNLLSSDGSDSGEDEDDDGDGSEDGEEDGEERGVDAIEEEVEEEQVEVEGWVDFIEGEEVEIQTVVNISKALKEMT